MGAYVAGAILGFKLLVIAIVIMVTLPRWAWIAIGVFLVLREAYLFIERLSRKGKWPWLWYWWLP